MLLDVVLLLDFSFTARSCPRSSHSSSLLQVDVVVDRLLLVVIDLPVLRVLFGLLHIDSLGALDRAHSMIRLDRLVVT